MVTIHDPKLRREFNHLHFFAIAVIILLSPVFIIIAIMDTLFNLREYYGKYKGWEAREREKEAINAEHKATVDEK